MSAGRRASLARILAFAFVLGLSGPAVLPSMLSPPRVASAHPPISIDGNGGLTPANGVVAGSGTAADPFLIADWEITGSASLGVQVRNTDAFVVLRNLTVQGYPVGLFFYHVRNVRLENITSMGNAFEGVRVESSDRFSVVGSHVSSNGAGLIFLGTTNASLVGNRVLENDRDGILLQDSPGAQITGNEVAGNGREGGRGLALLASPAATLSGNRLTDDGIVLAGDSLEAFDTHTIGEDNLVDGRPVRYLRGCDGVRLDGIVAGQILLANCRHTFLANVTLPASDVGVLVAYGSDLAVGPGLRVANATVGIWVQSASNVHVVGAEFLDVSQGVVVRASRDVSVSRTKIAPRFLLGLLGPGAWIEGSSRINVSASVVEYALGGVFAVDTTDLAVVRNKLDANVAFGVDLGATRDVLLAGNKITRSGGGIRVAAGTNVSILGNAIYVNRGPGVQLTNSTGVGFLLNDVVDNALPQALDTFGPENLWDAGYPRGGNHWSDYVGRDACSGPGQDVCTGPDGIGDSPYPIDGNSTDRYPLMDAPFSIDTPPDALFTVSPRGGDTGTSFRVDASASSDLEDATADLRFRWDWEGDGSWDTAWSFDPKATHVYPIAGNYTIRLEVMDRGGQTDTWSEAVSVGASADTSPPEVHVMAPARASTGERIPVTAEVTDPSGIASVVLYFRGVGDSDFHPVGMAYTAGASYGADIPPQAAPGQVAIYVIAEDGAGNRARDPAAGTYLIEVVDTRWPWILAGLAVSGAAGTVVYVLWRRRHRLLHEPLREIPRGPPGNP